MPLWSFNSFQTNSEYTRSRGAALSTNFRVFSEKRYSVLNPVPGPLSKHNTRFIRLLPSGNVGALFEPHFAWFDGNLEEKMARKQYSMVERAFQELAIDINSDMEPEDEGFWVFFCCCFFLPDGDDFVAESSDEAAR